MNKISIFLCLFLLLSCGQKPQEKLFICNEYERQNWETGDIERINDSFDFDLVIDTENKKLFYSFFTFPSSYEVIDPSTIRSTVHELPLTEVLTVVDFNTVTGELLEWTFEKGERKRLRRFKCEKTNNLLE